MRGPPSAGTSRTGSEIARFGDNMREVAVTEGDKVEAQTRLGFSVNGYGVGDLVAAVDARRRRRRRPSSSTAYDGELRRRAGAAPRAATGTTSCATAARIEAGLRALPRRRRLRRVHRHVRGPRHASTSCPGIGVQRLMADGYGFGAEGDWKTAALVRILKVMGDGPAGRHVVHGGLHVPPRRARSRRSSARTCSRSARRSPAAGPSCEIHPLSIGGKSDPVRLVFDAAPGPGGRPRPGRSRRPLPADRERGRRRRARRAAAEAAGRPGGLAAATRPRDRGRGLADRRRAAPHRADDRARARRDPRLRRDRRDGAASPSTPPRPAGRSRTSCAGTRRTTS